MRFIYNLFIQVYIGLIRLASFRSNKAAQWWEGRSAYRMGQFPEGLEGCVWVHCASLGEFEQGRPLIEAIAKVRPEQRILLTFFSPSGYEIRKNYDKVTAVHYLPKDTPSLMQCFVEAVKPRAVIFVKYEFWFNLLEVLQQSKIPHFLISGVFRKDQHFFKWYGAWFRKHLNGFSSIHVQNADSQRILESIKIEAKVSGDTRFDRVLEVCKEVKPIPFISAFAMDSSVIVVGSSWPKDEALIAKSKKEIDERGWKCIIVPHEVGDDHMKQIQVVFPEASRFSKTNMDEVRQAKWLIVDQIGYLNQIYQYADIAWIGGGFGKGVHNTLEAAAYGIPILCGPNNQKFKEIQDLKHLGACMEVNQKNAVDAIVQLMDQSNDREKRGQKSLNYVKQHEGATEKAMQSLREVLEN